MREIIHLRMALESFTTAADHKTYVGAVRLLALPPFSLHWCLCRCVPLRVGCGGGEGVLGVS